MPCSSHDDMTQHPAKVDFFVSDYDKEWEVYGRDAAIDGAQSLRALCQKTVFYTDLGTSKGMTHALEYCQKNNLPYELRTLNYDNVLSLGAELISREFIDAIVQNKPYTQFISGTPLHSTENN